MEGGNGSNEGLRNVHVFADMPLTCLVLICGISFNGTAAVYHLTCLCLKSWTFRWSFVDLVWFCSGKVTQRIGFQQTKSKHSNETT